MRRVISGARQTRDPGAHDGGHLLVLPSQRVVPTDDPNVGHRSGNGGRRRFELVGGAEGVPGSGDEQAGDLEGTEVCSCTMRQLPRIRSKHMVSRIQKWTEPSGPFLVPLMWSKQ